MNIEIMTNNKAKNIYKHNKKCDTYQYISNKQPEFRNTNNIQ